MKWNSRIADAFGIGTERTFFETMTPALHLVTGPVHTNVGAPTAASCCAAAAYSATSWQFHVCFTKIK